MTTLGNIWGDQTIRFTNTASTYTLHINPSASQIRTADPLPPPIKHLKQDHSPNCCGCDFMSWFPQPNMDGEIDKKIIEQVQAQLKEHKARYNSMMLVILNNPQRPFYEKMLLDEGYKMIMGPVYHPDHKHNLYLYGYEKHPNHPNASRS